MSRQKTFDPNELRRWRDRLGFTQVAAAKALGIPLRTYQGWEHGRRKTHLALIRAQMARVKPKKASKGNDPQLL